MRMRSRFGGLIMAVVTVGALLLSSCMSIRYR